ncbi:MAG: cysteine--tRNA ligase [Candidatus Algichlamydia australiensis]|nr:cysteine--tRNA ligase [Chlamydiales bacterium]
MVKFFNTHTRKKESLKPQSGKTFRIYTCGPTVYDYAHIGNFRTYVFEDLLRRTLQYFGYKVHQVMNITDVDDKTIRGALAKKQSLSDYTKPYTKAFFEDLKTLFIEPVESYPKATDHFPEMIAMIETLLKKEIAYKGSDNSIYFRIASFSSYGNLSHLKLDELEQGASERVASDEYEKETAADFVLWKAYDEKRDGNIFWESPFGKGRPGWHLECSAMARKHLGDTLDIHCGGVDNIFPHHENEIAQSECCTGKTFARHWMHSEHLLVDNKKMSKSLGNFYTLRNLLDKGYSGREVRYLLLSTHYRTQLNFTLDGLTAARNSLKRLDDFVQRLKQAHGAGNATALITETEKRFSDGLADDLNISVSLAALFDLVRDVNRLIDKQELSEEGAQEVFSLLQKFNTVLAALNFEKKELSVPAEVEELLTKRNAARSAKNWAEADRFRDQILEKGFTIVDEPGGSHLKAL